MATWVSDFRHLVAPDAKDAQAAARRRARFTSDVVEAATSRRKGPAWRSAVRCIARVGRRACRAYVDVGYNDEQRIGWSCAACGEQGTITGFAGAAVDLSRYVPRGKEVLWGFDEQERKLLRDATEELPNLRAVLARACPQVEIPGLLLVDATVPELDLMYTLVEDLTDLTRSWQRCELLDGLRASLCTSIDGF
jgi:hypothetical protein